MMDPELIRIAQEQMSRMSPAELAKIQQQMMSNPELLKMASESMKNLRTEDLKHAAEQLKHTRPEDMAEISQKMANASPEELASIRSQADARVAYEISGAEMLKKQGNELHGQGKYSEASQKYNRAKTNLKGIPSIKGKALMLACSLNLMSCYLKTRQYEECVKEGSEVLSYDAKNVKALYRRGQAYKELGQIEGAVLDLGKAHEISPDDDTITEVLRDTEEKLREEDGRPTRTSSGLVIEEINEEPMMVPSKNAEASSSSESSVLTNESADESKVRDDGGSHSSASNSEYLHALKENPDAMRSFQNFVSNADPDTLANMGGVNTGEIPPDMFKTASNMISKMSPEELQKMVNMASSFEGSPLIGQGAGFGSGSVPPNLSPEMMKTASEMMSKMSPEEYQRMFEMASSLKQRDSFSAATPSTSSRASSDSRSRFPEARENMARERSDNITNENQSFDSLLQNVRNTSQSSFPMSTSDMQEQMRDRMKDPAMREMFTSMMKNMSPDMMSSMSEQFGVKLSKEDAAKAQQAMANMSPEDLEKMMKWADRVQKGVEGVKKTKTWLLGKPGMILAICMLILAIILHRLGFIGG